MNIVIAPNAFKGSLSAEEAANSIAKGLCQSNLSCKLDLIPIGDGGDGTASLIAKKWNSRSIAVQVHDPLGRIIKASFEWVVKEKTVLIEMSEASGLKLLKSYELNPLKANTMGTGELIAATLRMNVKKIILAVGGSATVDGGTGLLKALGIRFLNGSGREITQLPAGLIELKSIDINKLDPRLKTCEIIILCDVTNTLLGNKGAAVIFGPQKGASKKEVSLLEKCMEQFNQITQESIDIEMSSMVYGGAAGGMAAGLAAFLNAQLVGGIEYFLDAVHFNDALEKADMVITAEGSLDEQTLEGKGPFGVAVRAKKKKIPVIVLAGHVPLKVTKKMKNYFDGIFPINHAPSSIEEAIKNTSADLTRTSCEVGDLLALHQK
ncbi:MAG TPA: glycerate kinase [Hanamia sp.]|nr:glycerate kinase [Hanamia sp.]